MKPRTLIRRNEDGEPTRTEDGDAAGTEYCKAASTEDVKAARTEDYGLTAGTERRTAMW